MEESYGKANLHSIVKVFCKVLWKSRFLVFRSRFESFLKEEVTDSLHVLFQLIHSRWAEMEAFPVVETKEMNSSTWVTKNSKVCTSPGQ